MTATFKARGRIASFGSDAPVVAGNTYAVGLDLDSEWTGSLYMRVRFGSYYYDIPFASSASSVDVQLPVGYPEVGLGVFSEALQICTSEARVKPLRSILEAGEQVVEFDGDLYDQWAGEVAEVICDDAFDADSPRPVKNSVLTAWKAGVPLNSDVFHTSGDEYGEGDKYLDGDLTVFGKTSVGELAVAPVDATDLSVGYWRHVLDLPIEGGAGRACFLATPSLGSSGLPTAVSVFAGGQGPPVVTYAGYSPMGYGFMGARRKDGAIGIIEIWVTTGYYQRIRMYGFGTPSGASEESASQPSGLSLAHDVAGYVTEAGLASSTAVVHTTGDESVGGVKTFTSAPVLGMASPQIQALSSLQSGDQGTRMELLVQDQKDGAPSTQSTISAISSPSLGFESVGLSASKPARNGAFDLQLRAYADHGEVKAPSYYPVDGNGNPQPLAPGDLMTSGNIAVDPRIVHTTGNETIAGTKTFGRIVCNDYLTTLGMFTSGVGKWTRLYEITPHSNTGNIFFKTFAATSKTLPGEVQLFVAGSASSMEWLASGNPMGLRLVAAKRSSDGHVEVWGRRDWTSWQVAYRYRHAVTMGDQATADEPPAVGSDYSIVATFGE